MGALLDTKSYLVLVFRRVYTVDLSRSIGSRYVVKLLRFELVTEFEVAGSLAALKVANTWRGCGRAYHVEVLPME